MKMPIGTIAAKEIEPDSCKGCVFDDMRTDICDAYECEGIIFANIDYPPTVRTSLREQFAGMAMQGLLSNPHNDSMDWHEWAHDAVGMADALIAELERTK